MGKVIANISMSLDGYVAGPNPTVEEPLGHRGEELHDWVVKLAVWREQHGMSGGETGPDSKILADSIANVGAVIMGRKMFSGSQGPWEHDPMADGWWGENPPFHTPVFILTSHSRPSVTKQGGTTFNFVTDGIQSALTQARHAAGDKDISVAGGANTIRQYIKAGLLDELQIHLVLILLGGGTRLLENLGEAKLEKIQVIDSPQVTHLTFQVK